MWHRQQQPCLSATAGCRTSLASTPACMQGITDTATCCKRRATPAGMPSPLYLMIATAAVEGTPADKLAQLSWRHRRRELLPDPALQQDPAKPMQARLHCPPDQRKQGSGGHHCCQSGQALPQLGQCDACLSGWPLQTVQPGCRCLTGVLHCLTQRRRVQRREQGGSSICGRLEGLQAVRHL